MNIRSLLVSSVLGACVAASPMVLAESMTKVGEPYEYIHIPPGERMIVGDKAGLPLLESATTDTITVPVTIANRVAEETRNYGPLGVVSGLIRGGFLGVVQAMRAGTKGATGVLDVTKDGLESLAY